MSNNREENLNEPNFTEEDIARIGQTFKFMKAAKEAREGQPPNTPIEFECPICKGKAVTSYSSYNGHPGGRCECGMNFMV